MTKTVKRKLSEVHKKYLKTAAYLLVSWGLALVVAGVSQKPALVGLAPLLNYLAYVAEKELLKDDGYLSVLRKK